MPIYLVKPKEGEGAERLVEAPNKASARNHVAKDTIAVEVAKQSDLFRVAKAGGDVEQAVADATPAPTPEPVGEATGQDGDEGEKTKAK